MLRVVNRRPSKGIGGDILNWLLGYESTRFKQFLKAHGAEKITSMAVGRTPIAKAVDIGFDIMSGGKFGEAKKKLGVDNFFHLFLIINGKYRIEKNETVNELSYSKSEKEENMNVPVKELTIDELIQRSSKGIEKDFWLNYNPLQNNCQQWVLKVLTKNDLITSEIRSFVNQDMEALLKELPHELPEQAQQITDVASFVNRILQLTTGGRAGFSVGCESLGDTRENLIRPKRKVIGKRFRYM